MNTKFIFSVIIFFIFSIFCYCDSTNVNKYQKAKELLIQANMNVNYSSFNDFYEVYSSLNEVTKNKMQIDSTIYNLVSEYLIKISSKSPTDSLLLSYYTIFNYFKNNAEGSELASELFSDYFMNDLEKSLNALGKIKDKNIQKTLASEAVFVEGRDIQIINYIEKNNLKNKNYYKYFLEYK